MALTFGDTCPGQDLTKPRFEEQVARELLGDQIDGMLIANSPDPPDFILCRDERVVGWLEVTTAVNEARLQLHDRLTKDGASIETDQLEYDWLVTFHTSTKIKDLDRDQLVKALTLKEDVIARDSTSKGDRTVHRLLAQTDIADNATAEAILDESGVAFTGPIGPASEGATAWLATPSFTSSAAPSLINDLAEIKAAEKETSLQGRSGELHLCVLVHSDEPTGVGFIVSGGFESQLPDTPPKLPNWVTDVWLVATRDRLWHISTSTLEWEVHDSTTG